MRATSLAHRRLLAGASGGATAASRPWLSTARRWPTAARRWRSSRRWLAPRRRRPRREPPTALTRPPTTRLGTTTSATTGAAVRKRRNSARTSWTTATTPGGRRGGCVAGRTGRRSASRRATTMTTTGCCASLVLSACPAWRRRPARSRCTACAAARRGRRLAACWRWLSRPRASLTQPLRSFRAAGGAPLTPPPACQPTPRTVTLSLSRTCGWRRHTGTPTWAWTPSPLRCRC